MFLLFVMRRVKMNCDFSKSIKIINWNIQSGGGKRIEQISEKIIKANPDIAVITEFRNGPKGVEFEGCLANAGFNVLKNQSPHNLNTVAICVRKSLDVSKSRLEIPSNLANHVLSARILGMDFVGVFGATPLIGRGFIEYLSSIESHEDEKIIAIGDFYYGPRKSNVNFGHRLSKLVDKGWINAWDTLCDSSECWSFSSGAGKSRPDHVFMKGFAEDVIILAKYDQDQIIHRLSDHAPMIVSLLDL